MAAYELAEGRESFTLACPGEGDSEVTSIRARGNLPLMIGGRVLAELDHADLNDNWMAAARLKPAEALRFAEEAGRRLSAILEDAVDAADLTGIVSDAAVLFLLTMKRHGFATPAAIPPCTIVWEGAAGQEHVLVRDRAGDDDDR